MPSFINFNNKQELSSNEYTKLQISEALYLTETKNSRKIESLTEGLNRNTSLKDALDLFENKLVAINALSATKQTYTGTLYEGQFSWMTSDTGQQIGSEKENTIEVWMYDNKGNQYYEKKYDGYGEFGGMDYYELLARMNGYTDEDLLDKKILKSIRVMGKGSMRDIGIALAFEKKLKTRDKGGDVLFPALVADGKYNWKRHNFKQEAESDPNQSWFQEEYDEREDEDDEDYEQGWYENLDLHTSLYEQAILENAVRDLHFEMDPKKAEDMKIEIGASQGEVTRKKQIEGGNYSLRRFRKEIKYWDGNKKELEFAEDVFAGPEHYNTAKSTLGAGPHAKKVKKVKWNQKKYDQWLEDVASNDGWKNAFDMAQNAKHEPGLLDWAKKEFRGEDVMQRIQWDIEAFAESVVTEIKSEINEAAQLVDEKTGKVVKLPYKTKDFRGDSITVKGFTEPHKSSSSGRIQTDQGEFFPGVAGVKIIGHKFESVDTKKLTWDSLKESLGLNEGRSINKISKEHSGVVLDMKKTVDEWKVAEGDRKSELLETLRALNNRKAELEKELDQAVAGKDSSVELALSETETIQEKDDAGTHLDNLADLVGNAKSFMAVGKELKDGNYKYDFSTGMMPMYMIKADGFKFAILNKRYVDGGDREVGDIAIGLMESAVTESKEYKAGDEVELKTGETVKINQVVKGPRAEFNTYRAKVKGKQIDFSLSDINESLNEQSDDALILIQQALKGMKNMKVDIKGDTIIVSNKAKDEFTYSMNDADDVQEFIATIEESVDLAKKKVESLDEGLRNDLKKFIKKNQEELDRLADGEQWEQLYLMLYTEFDVEPESKKAEDVKDAFDLTY